jgi:Protein phosphatase 2C
MLSSPNVRMFSAPKAGHSAQEYEDASCVASDLKQGGAISRYAVADGATETSFAGAWARALVMAYCQGLLSGEQAESTLGTLRQAWIDSVSGLSLPWFAEEKAQQGASATLCGLTLTAGRGGKSCKWQAQAIGDSCLVQVRKNAVICSFPLGKAAEFGSTPHMVSSIQSGKAKSKFLEAKGEGQAGDKFLLMTDALACSVMSQFERGLPPSQFLDLWQTHDSFCKYIDESRNTIDNNGNKQIKNDDVTLVMIEI